ncbi:hypothetical protein D1614_09475 [Maribellus luteus]|uniref:DUF4935 domain-containing protein n=1 Tax=Maribellus luteus TaxID=2305463 RepID=A0A399SXE8_9BACT|nr:PIN domain-containing protein [Maribellus luteus]RIJ48750.1 hypothetical protein D1614_09475 [Maribellus luteus]
MRTFIFLDTNNWIYLSNGFNVLSNNHDELHFKIFDIITKRVEDGSLVILVNDIVIDEWRRNKEIAEKQLKLLENKYKSYANNIKAIKNFVGSGKKKFKKVQKALKDKYDKKVKQYREHVDKVEDFLLNKTVKIEVSDQVKVEASNLALEKKAPFIGDKKNSMADALILLSAIEHIYENEKSEFPFLDEGDEPQFLLPKSCFVSSNSGDFSAPDNKENIHPDLEPYLSKTKTEFHYSLGKLINSLENEFLTIEEIEEIEHFDDRIHCPQCQYEYYPSVDFSDYFDIIDPNKAYYDKNQIRISFPDTDDVEIPDDMTSQSIRIRTAECNYCGTSFFECPCGELIPVEWSDRFECPGGCGTIYNVSTDAYRGEGINSFEVEIVKVEHCEMCGEEVESVNESGLCPDCAEIEERNVNG